MTNSNFLLSLIKATGVEQLADYREKFIIGASFSSSNSLNISLAPNQPPASVTFVVDALDDIVDVVVVASIKDLIEGTVQECELCS